MKKIATLGSLTLASALTGGLLAFQAPIANADDAFAKRDEDTADVVMSVDDDDDDDTGNRDDDTNGDNTGGTNTGASKSTNDGTNSNFTKASRDRDVSRSDKTKDFTRDGGDRTRDFSANQTNDASRNDTRG